MNETTVVACPLVEWARIAADAAGVVLGWCDAKGVKAKFPDLLDVKHKQEDRQPLEVLPYYSIGKQYCTKFSIQKPPTNKWRILELAPDLELLPWTPVTVNNKPHGDRNSNGCHRN